MTKKDYQKIAGVIYRSSETAFDAEGVPLGYRIIKWSALTAVLCLIFKADNPRFDEEKFMVACNTGMGTK
jgi:hypothetical protein